MGKEKKEAPLVSPEEMTEHLTVVRKSFVDYCLPLYDRQENIPTRGCKIQLFRDMAVTINHSIQSVVEFGKCLPGLRDQSQDVQLRLAKENSVPVLLICDLLFNKDQLPFLKFLDGHYLTHHQTVQIFGHEFADKYRRIKSELQQRDLPLDLIAMFSANVFFSGGDLAADERFEERRKKYENILVKSTPSDLDLDLETLRLHIVVSASRF